ncbi:helix-turn-helix transcriptional regulator [Amaricoccus sp.]|uniref:helix-turn-helix domain-containing protein n=1 Tax=Amaricoccus sp. TaxID=1872485 RepID=UPI001B4FDD43|nr:helix-turn-helix transcriptional regulator [Amaricoccus sp.]MBP7001692.1 helix-turn-helix transcriptional regulator [Amaricoccus sp.]
MPALKSSLAMSLEYWLKLKGMSQAQLSAKAGLATSAVNDILRSPDRSPRLSTLEQLADALEISVWQLIAGAAEPSYAANTMPGGIRVIPWETFTDKEREFYLERAEATGVPKEAVLGEVLNWDSVALGYMPGELVAIIPAREYMGEVVAVRYSDHEFVGVRYCASPWLIGFVDIGLIAHEFMEAPGLEILGAVRRIRFGRLEQRPRFGLVTPRAGAQRK